MDPTMRNLQPGNYIVVPGGGWIGAVIRDCETQMYEKFHPPGWKAWAGHVGVYIGNNQVVAATYPKAKIFPLSDFHDGRANTAEPLTTRQRDTIVGRAIALEGDDYDVMAYPLFLALTIHAATTKDLSKLLANDRCRVCSALVGDCYMLAGIGMVDVKVPNLVTPEFLDDRIVTGNWGHA